MKEVRIVLKAVSEDIPVVDVYTSRTFTYRKHSEPSICPKFYEITSALAKKEKPGVYERVTGPYNDLRWLADVSSQCFYPPTQVWYQFIDSAGMKDSFFPVVMPPIQSNQKP
ncbi:hypothetical protein RB195_014711 [Necator americanus]|uniref:Uncharacterized protein n=1 Tax=Necator americanus TaxID=51031 RepID=A0ABR1E414_NECAM